MIEPDGSSSSPFFNASPPAGMGVVIHATRSGVSNNPNEVTGTLNWFKNASAQVSSHWVIGRDGLKIRVIPDHHQAWHAGEHNATHWGIELAQGVEDDGFTQVQIDALVAVCKGYRDDFGVPAVHAPSVLIRGFLGHQETVQGKKSGKTDPGKLFPWDTFITALNPPAATWYPPGDVAMACVSAAQFHRMKWNFGDMLPSEKEILKWIASQV